MTINLPDIQDPEGDKIFILTYIQPKFPCGCVNFFYEKNFDGSKAKIRIKIDRSKFTIADQLNGTGYIEIVDENYPETFQKTVYEFPIKVVYDYDSTDFQKPVVTIPSSEPEKEEDDILPP